MTKVKIPQDIKNEIINLHNIGILAAKGNPDFIEGFEYALQEILKILGLKAEQFGKEAINDPITN